MTAWRVFFRNHPALAMLLVAAALAVKAMVPAGFMVGSDARTITVQICADTFGGHQARQITLTIPGKHDGGADHAKAAASCPFGALAMAGLGGADPVLLAAAIAFILALGFAAPRTLQAARPARLRPPLRAPPAAI
jgi:hypothetical protein